jgi:hypothetical protein
MLQAIVSFCLARHAMVLFVLVAFLGAGSSPSRS